MQEAVASLIEEASPEEKAFMGSIKEAIARPTSTPASKKEVEESMSPRMKERVEQMKRVHANAAILYNRMNGKEHFINLYKHGAIKTLTQTGEELKRMVSITTYGAHLFNCKDAENILFDLHFYASLALILKKSYAGLKTMYDGTSEWAQQAIKSGQKEVDGIHTSKFINVLSALNNTLQTGISRDRELFEGLLNQPRIDANTLSVDALNSYLDEDRSDAIEHLQKEGLELFIKKNTDYGDAFAEYGIIGVIVRIEDKLKRLASITSNKKIQIADEGITDTLADLFNYTAMALMLYKE